MRKNYSFFNKVAGFVLAMAMMVGFTSCEDILGEWDKPSPVVQEVIETVVNVTGADPSEVTAALKAVITDEAVAAAAAKGEPIKVTISGSGVSTEATDQTITIPQKSGANIEITFATAPSGTGSNALEFTGEGITSGTTSGDSDNELAISMPSGTSGLVITIDLPTTTVTLTTNGTTVYKEVTAKTATSTLIIDKGVKVEKLILDGGDVLVNEGGEIETICMIAKTDDCGLQVGKWWASYGWGPPESGVGEGGMIKTDEINEWDPEVPVCYMPKNVRVEKGEGSYIFVGTIGPDDQILENLTIGDGLTTAIDGGTRAKNIEGEGTTAKLNVRGYVPAEKDPEEPGYDAGNHNFYYFFDKNTASVSNLTIVPEKNDAVLTTEELGGGNFVSFQMEFFGKANGITELIFENCNFKFDAPRVAFELYCFNPTEADFENFKGVLILKNCTINGEPITDLNFNLFNTGGNTGASYQVKMITGETEKIYNVTAGQTTLNPA